MNKESQRFVMKLIAGYHPKPSQETIDLYLEKFNRWILTSEQWESALDKILQQNTEFLPTLGIIYPYLLAAKQIGKEDLAMLRFTMPDGKTYYKAHRVWDESRKEWKLAPLAFKLGEPVPSIPDEATNKSILPLKPMNPFEAYQLDPDSYPKDPAEMRECFRDGWVKSGADPAKCDAMFRRLISIDDRRDERGLTHIADYDDSQKEKKL